jgi:hypothetical protein
VRRRLERTLVVGLVMVTSGCFRYLSVSPSSAPPVGEEVRARLSEGGLVRLAPEIREQQRGSVVEGEVVEADGSALVLAVSLGSEGAPQRSGRDLRQRVVIPVADVMELELRQLDKKRTAVVLGGAATLLGAFAITELFGGFGGSSRPPGPPDPPEMTGGHP